MLDEPIINFSQTIVDDTVKANADFQYKAGLSPKIIRTSTGKCCKWCDKLAGVYDYEKVSDTGNDVFRRHRACKCLVEYNGNDGKRQNVHTKAWSKEVKAAKIKETPKGKEKRIKEEKGLDFVSRISEHPKMLRAYTPNDLYNALKNSGYTIKPLKGKNYKDIPFEVGGGFRVHFGGDGILMYHPGERSHHGGEYQQGKVERKDMTAKEMRLKRIDDLNDRLAKKYKSIYISETTAFLMENGQVFRVDSIGKFNAIVVEYAENIELARKDMFGEDGDLFYLDDMNEDEMYAAMIEEIES